MDRQRGSATVPAGAERGRDGSSARVKGGSFGQTASHLPPSKANPHFPFAHRASATPGGGGSAILLPTCSGPRALSSACCTSGRNIWKQSSAPRPSDSCSFSAPAPPPPPPLVFATPDSAVEMVALFFSRAAGAKAAPCTAPGGIQSMGVGVGVGVAVSIACATDSLRHVRRRLSFLSHAAGGPQSGVLRGHAHGWLGPEKHRWAQPAEALL